MSKNVLKIVPIHVYRFSFFNTSNTYRAFSNYFWLRCKPLVNSRVGDSNRLLSEVFERKADYFILTTSSKKNFSLIASRMETKYLKYCENYVFVWKLSRFYIFSFFHAAYLSRWKRTTFADQGLYIENGRLFSNSKQNIYVWNLRLREYQEKHKSYLQGVFQLIIFWFRYDNSR